MQLTDLLFAVTVLSSQISALPLELDSQNGITHLTKEKQSPKAQLLKPDKKAISADGGSGWFLPNLDHQNASVRGYVPDLGDNSATYPVYIAVDSGHSQGFINALYTNGQGGQRDNMWLVGQPRVIYLAPGIYTLSETLWIDTDTVIIGDALSPPILQAASTFSGDFLIGGGQDGASNGGESHFSVSIRNVILDTTQNTGDSGFTALNWRVAQNSALNNVQINMPHGIHTGIYLGQGSTVSVGDVVFNSGSIGLHYDGSQQAQLKNLQFNQSTTGLLIDNGQTITVLAPTCNTVGQCIVLRSGSPWVAILDGTSIESGDFFTSEIEFPNFMLENISKDTTNSNMVTVHNNVLVADEQSVGQYIYGNTYGANPVYQTSQSPGESNRSQILAPGGKYPIFAAPQYANLTANDVINLKDSNQNGGYTLHGDGSTDDTQALQGAFDTAAFQGKVAYLPFGIYRVTSTITIPSGSQIYGEAWSTISGSGKAFQDVNNPTAIVRVGAPGSQGTAILQDLRFTVGESLPGAIILQINMAGGSPGDVAVFNSLITVGGTRDASFDCGDEGEQGCIGAYVGLHFAPGSSAYVDNFWSWVADHSSDGTYPANNYRTANKGGILVESQAGTWLMGVASEHWWLYNLNYYNAQNVVTTFYQSETNYNQGSKDSSTNYPPAPFTANPNDPDFSWCGGGDIQCRMTIAEFYGGSDTKNIWHYGAGSWNFYGGLIENMNVIQDQIDNAHLYGYTDHRATYLFRLPDGTQFGNGSSDGFGGSWQALVANVASQS